jgi:1-deoxy-D-xylulose-5-phosphate reductoisomerase
MPTVYNAANELAVSLFLERKITWPQITELIGMAMDNHKRIENPNVEQILQAQAQTEDFLHKTVNK